MVFEGPMWQTILKICGIALIPASIGAMIDHSVEGINGNILSVFGAIGFYLLLTKIVLRQQWQDTGIVVFSLWVIRAIVMYCIYKIQSGADGVVNLTRTRLRRPDRAGSSDGMRMTLSIPEWP